MNYLKTKTIQKQRTIIGSSLLSTLLLFFLLVSCDKGRHYEEEGQGPKTQHRDAEDPHLADKEKFLVELGGWSRCGEQCFLNNVIADSKDEKISRTGYRHGEKTFLLPKYYGDTNKRYFKGLVGQAVVGDKTGRGIWERTMERIRREKGVNKVRQGIYGRFKDVVEVGLNAEKDASFSRGTGIYVIFSYLKFIREVREAIEHTKDDKQLAIELKAKYKELEDALESVKPKGKGVAFIMPVGGGAHAEHVGYKFIFFEEGGKKTGREKNYVLNKGEYKKLKDVNVEIKKDLDKLIKVLKGIK
ncbi:MAG: hypothetical protein BGO68_05505 [Candidatus Amoebophilus sp. 36-38]|mgnify:CR=1 FL=1|nr:MAG: hypothetical protein BGO68_05505 [Candidatus Amoebophilus sp. 36-38]